MNLTTAPTGMTVTIGATAHKVVALVLEPAPMGGSDHQVRPVVIIDGKLQLAPRTAPVAIA